MNPAFRVTTALRPLWPLSLLCLLSACATVGPDYRPPQPAAVQLQGSASAAFDRQASVAVWWGQFDDAVLDGLMRLSLADNVDLYIAMARVRQARAAFAGQRAAQRRINAGTGPARAL